MTLSYSWQAPAGAKLPARALPSWLIGIISVLAVVVAWATAITNRHDPTNFTADLLITFFIPMVAAALCIEVLVREGWHNHRTIRRHLYWCTFLLMPLGAFTAGAYLTTLMPDWYRGEGVGVWFGHLLLEAAGVVLSPILWMFVVFPLGLLIPLADKVVRGTLSPRALYAVVLLLSIGGIIICAPLAFDYPGPRSFGSVIMSILGVPGNYWVESTVLAWVCRGLALLILIVLIDLAIASRRENVADAAAATSVRKPREPRDRRSKSNEQPSEPNEPPSKVRGRRRKLNKRAKPVEQPEPSALDVYDPREAEDEGLPPGAPKPLF